MTIKIKLKNIQSALQSFANISEKDNNLPQQLSYDIGKIMSLLYKEQENYQNSVNELIKKSTNGKQKIENGKICNIWDNDKDQIQCETDLKELANVEIELEVKLILRSGLRNRNSLDKEAEELNIAGTDFMFLKDFIVEDNGK